ncbi:MAG: YggS family pyridoxal phosphate-dependent enzyme [Alphaproteobacteria bacterium]|nr:YggS family pyridoxal phosphate-dependent enzyme [Alphaproteobacteria bacterium]
MVDRLTLVLDNYRQVQFDLALQLQHARRTLNSCQLLLASKQQPRECIDVLLGAGHRLFGENYVQEAGAKWPVLKANYSGVQLHLIGHLQANKAITAISLFDVIETLDRSNLAHSLVRAQEKLGVSRQYFVQVNTGREPQKSGIDPKDTGHFIDACRKLGLEIVGLMAIPPVHQHPAPHFALLARLAADSGLKRLSMGMSDDYSIAVRLGSTQVRLGSKVFGPRPN